MKTIVLRRDQLLLPKKPSHNTKDWADELALFCVRADFDDEKNIDELSQMLSNEIDWQRAMSNLQRHRLSRIFHRFVVSADCAHKLPAPVWEQLKQECLITAAYALAQEVELRDVLHHFAREGIAPIVLKGAYLDQKIYSCKNVRQSIDIDLFLKEEDIVRSKQLLMKLGYETVFESLRLLWRKPYPTISFVKNGLVDIYLEVQWSFPALKPYRHTTAVDANCIWAQAHPSKLCGAPVYLMRPEHFLIYLCAHLSTQHQFDRLIWIRDLKEMLRFHKDSIDWSYLIECSSKWRVLTFVYFSLSVAERVSGASIPYSVLGEMRPRYFSARLFERGLLRTNFVQTPSERPWVVSKLLLTLRDRMTHRVWAVAGLPRELFGRLVRRTKIWPFVTQVLVKPLKERQQRKEIVKLGG